MSMNYNMWNRGLKCLETNIDSDFSRAFEYFPFVSTCQLRRSAKNKTRFSPETSWDKLSEAILLLYQS